MTDVDLAAAFASELIRRLDTAERIARTLMLGVLGERRPGEDRGQRD